MHKNSNGIFGILETLRVSITSVRPSYFFVRELHSFMLLHHICAPLNFLRGSTVHNFIMLRNQRFLACCKRFTFTSHLRSPSTTLLWSGLALMITSSHLRNALCNLMLQSVLALIFTSSQLRKRPLQLFGVVGEHLRPQIYFITSAQPLHFHVKGACASLLSAKIDNNFLGLNEII